jgi:lysophospholipase L1-like esterase
VSPYILIGDSQAVGMKARLAELMRAGGIAQGAVFANVGWSTLRYLNERTDEIRDAVREHNPRLVIIVLGGNDMPGPRLSESMRRLIDLVRSGGAQVVWVGPAHAIPPDIAERKRQVSEIQKRVATETGIAWLDGFAMTRDLTHTRDGVHFTSTGSGRWAERIVSALAIAPGGPPPPNSGGSLWGFLKHLTPFAAFLPLTKEGL